MVADLPLVMELPPQLGDDPSLRVGAVELELVAEEDVGVGVSTPREFFASPASGRKLLPLAT